jgi:hypothetical protein
MHFSSVDFPPPFGPKIAVNDPGARSSETPLIAARSPYPAVRPTIETALC